MDTMNAMLDDSYRWDSRATAHLRAMGTGSCRFRPGVMGFHSALISIPSCSWRGYGVPLVLCSYIPYCRVLQSAVQPLHWLLCQVWGERQAAANPGSGASGPSSSGPLNGDRMP